MNIIFKSLMRILALCVIVISVGCNGSDGGNDTTGDDSSNKTGGGSLPSSVAGQVITMVFGSAQTGALYNNNDQVLFTFSSSGSLMLTTQYTVVASTFEVRGSEYIWVDSSNSVEYALSLQNDQIHEVNLTGLSGSPFYGQFTIPTGSSGSGISGVYGGNMLGTELSLNGDVSTLSGQAGTTGNTAGTATTSTYYYPGSIVTDGTYLYITEKQDNVLATKAYIRKISISTGESTILNGPYSTSGSNGVLTMQNNVLYIASNDWLGSVDTTTGTSTQITTGISGITAASITSDGTYIYVSDSTTGKIHKVTISDGTASVFVDLAVTSAVTNGGMLTTDGTYLYMSASASGTVYKITLADGTVEDMALGLQNPEALATDGTYLYITKLWHYDVIKVKLSDKSETTVAGSTWTSGDSDGNSTSARFGNNTVSSGAFGATLSTDGVSLFVADQNNHIIRKID